MTKYKHDLPHPLQEPVATLQDCPADSAYAAAAPQALSQIITALKSCRDAIAGSLQPHISISRSEIETILKEADAALEIAKHFGGNI